MTEQTVSGGEKASLSPLPDIGDFLFLIVLLFPLLLLPNYLFADASTGWHLAIGDYVLKNGQVPYKDFLSYSQYGKPWIAFYWLADLFLSLANKACGLNGVALLVSTTIATLFLCIYERCRRFGCNFLLAALLVLVGAAASTVHWLARPHIVTFVGVYVFATILEDFHRQRISTKKTIAILSATMLVWANSHPGFILGFAQMAIYMVVATGLLLSGRQSTNRKELPGLCAAAATMLAATLINPYGLALHQNLSEYLKQSTVTNYVDEYLSPVFHGALQSNCLELIFLALACGLAFHKTKPSIPQVLLVLAFGHLALSAMRNIPLFILVALPLAGELLGGIDLARLGTVPMVSRLLLAFRNLNMSVDREEARCRMHLLPLAAVVFLAIAAGCGGSLAGKSILACGFSPQVVPTNTLACIKTLPADRGFNNVNWGGYIYYYAGVPVYIDDRSSFYGEAFYLQYGRIVSLFDGWQEALNKQKINWIIFPKGEPLSKRLMESQEWRILCQDQAAYVFLRKNSK